MPVHDRQLLKELQPVVRFAPRPAASECRAVVIGGRRPAELDPNQGNRVNARPKYMIFSAVVGAQLRLEQV